MADKKAQPAGKPAGCTAESSAGKSVYVQLLTEICAEEGIRLDSWSSDWAFRLTKGGRQAFILGYQFGLNPASVQQICTDKNITSEILRDSGIPCVPHSLVMSPSLLHYNGREGGYAKIFRALERYGTIVLKDNVGTGGNQVYLASTPAEAEYAASQIFQVSRSLAVCPCRDIRQEVRLVLLDGKIRLAFEKIRPSVTGDGSRTLGQLIGEALAAGRPVGNVLPEGAALRRIPAQGEAVPLNWKHNLGQGARPRLLTGPDLPAEAVSLAKAAARALSVRFASVDVIRTDAGFEILEVNSGVMMEHFASCCAAYRHIAREIYRDAVRRMFEGSGERSEGGENDQF